MKLFSKTAAIIFLLIVVAASCKKEIKEPSTQEMNASASQSKQPLDPGFVENNMVLYWNDKVATVLGASMNQPTRSRYFAMMEIAVHDALNNIKPKYERYALNDREQFADPDAAVAAAAYWAIKGLGRQGTFPVDAWYAESLATIPDGESKEIGKALGKKAADAIIANRANDGFTQVTLTSLTPSNGILPGEYRSTVTAVNYVPTQTLFPFRTLVNWGSVMKPYVIENNHQFRPAGPYPVNSSEYNADFNEVKTKGDRVGSTRNADEEKIAQFFSENRPSLTWNNIVRKAIEGKKLDAWKTARLFALVHTCIADDINAYFDANYHFYFWRPETAIRLANTDGNDNTAGDANWLPAFSEVPTSVTPPVPGYPNGVAAFGGSTTEILRLFLSRDATDIDVTSTTPNPTVTVKPTLHFSSFSEAEKYCSLGLIYAGWDFRKSALDGEAMGRNIAGYVFTHAFREAE